MAIPDKDTLTRLRSVRIVTVCAILCSFLLSGCTWRSDDDNNTKGIYPENNQVYPYNPGWYHGVLHSHAWYDVGSWLTPIADVVDLAEDQGFDFFVLTNHNTVFQWANPGYQSTQLTVLYGMEWTSSQGHANIWSDRPFDRDTITPTAATGDVEGAIDAVHDLSTRNHPVLFSINHPDRLSQSSWKASRDASTDADAMEVWNGSSTFVSPGDTYPSYIGYGLKMTMVGGSDAHLKEADDMQIFTTNLGRPTTWVYAESRSGKDILTGIRHGHAFISASQEGPRLDFTAGSSLGVLMMGDTIPMSDLGNTVSFTVSVSNDNVPYAVVLVKNGVPQEPWSRACSDPENSFAFTDAPLAGDYFRVEVRQLAALPASFDELLQGTISALSNPIYTW